MLPFSLSVLIMNIVFSGTVGSLKVCDYLRLIGRSSPDCYAEETETAEKTTLSPLASIILSIERGEARKALVLYKGQHKRPEKSANLELCTGSEHNDCRLDDSCVSSYSCLSQYSSKRCCLRPSVNHMQTKAHSTCPSTSQLGYVCFPNSLKSKQTSWCKTNEDCSKTKPQICCDTGCGFNVCVHNTDLSVENGLRLESSDKCPALNTFPMKCVPKRKYTNWCNKDSDCNIRGSRSVDKTVKRLCCPTPCGYNTCINIISGTHSLG